MMIDAESALADESCVRRFDEWHLVLNILFRHIALYWRSV
jgi:hypothetical protein